MQALQAWIQIVLWLQPTYQSESSGEMQALWLSNHESSLDEKAPKALYANVKMFYCEHCEFKASSTFVLGVHRNKTHGQENKCPYCDFETENNQHFKIHTERCKKSTESFSCQYCNKRFTFILAIKSHIQYQHHRCRFCKHFAVSELARKAHENGSHESELKGRWIVHLEKKKYF